MIPLQTEKARTPICRKRIQQTKLEKCLGAATNEALSITVGNKSQPRGQMSYDIPQATVGPFLVVHNVSKAYYSQNIKNQNEIIKIRGSVERTGASRHIHGQP